MATVPSLILFFLWQSFEGSLVNALVMAQLPSSYTSGEANPSLVYSQIMNISRGLAKTDDPNLTNAAKHYAQLMDLGLTLRTVALVSLSLVGLAAGWKLARPKVRSRVHVEKVLQIFLLFCSTIAILTTAGIVLSVLFEAIRFFNMVPITEFIFGTEWSPQIALRADQEGASGAFGAIPLFTGTMMISFIAMLIAAPVG